MTRPASQGLLLVVGLAVALALPRAIAAHEVLHSIARGEAVAIKAYFADGEVLAYTACEVFSPSDPKIPWQKGRTDRGGWVAFVPDTPGLWRVRVADDSGHGLDLLVEAGGGDGPDEAASQGDLTSSAAFVLRAIVGLLVIALIFAALVLVYRRKGDSQ